MLADSRYQRAGACQDARPGSRNALDSLAIATIVRGLSVRDVEATLAESLGDQAAISKSTVSATCQQIKEEYQAWERRRLDEVTLDYLFLTGLWRSPAVRKSAGCSPLRVSARWLRPCRPPRRLA
jgi:hypothetical protein